MENLWIFEQLEEFLDLRSWRILDSRIQQFDGSSIYGSFSSGSSLQSLSVFQRILIPHFVSRRNRITDNLGLGYFQDWEHQIGTELVCQRAALFRHSREWRDLLSRRFMQQTLVACMEHHGTGKLQSSVRNWESSLFLLVQPRYNKNLVLFVTLVATFFKFMAFV